jgi:hypothetical protein
MAAIKRDHIQGAEALLPPVMPTAMPTGVLDADLGL